MREVLSHHLVSLPNGLAVLGFLSFTCRQELIQAAKRRIGAVPGPELAHRSNVSRSPLDVRGLTAYVIRSDAREAKQSVDSSDKSGKSAGI